MDKGVSRVSRISQETRSCNTPNTEVPRVQIKLISQLVAVLEGKDKRREHGDGTLGMAVVVHL
jgi:hypothetical protein